MPGDGSASSSKASTGAQEHQTVLGALRRYLLAEDLSAAARFLSNIDENELTAEDRWQLELLQADRLALEGDFLAAEAVLGQAGASLPASAWQAAWMQSRAHVHIAQGRASDALGVLESIAQEGRNQDWHDLLWKALVATPPSFLSEKDATTRAQRLAHAYASASTLLEQQQALRQALAISTAGEAPLARSVRAVLSVPEAPIRVGLVLPMQGPLQAFGAAFLQGFSTAWYASSEHTRVSFILYDAEDLMADADYSRLAAELIRDRIELVIGPVSRSKLAPMQRALPSDVGWIALNRLADHDALRPGQFALELSTEDEVEALAQRIRAEKKSRVLAYYAPTGWSVRAADTLQSALGDDSLLGRVELSDAAAVTEEVGLSLLVDRSEARIRNVSRLLQGAVETKARRRQDVDAIVMLVDGSLASAVGPALRFHDAGDVQRFATSRMMREVPADEYGILEGTAFFDLPWNLSESDYRRQMRSEFGPVAPMIDTLRAIGVDCFRLADRFNLLRATQRQGLLDIIHGASGTLRASGTRIKRQLVWSQVRSGAIEAVDMNE